MSGLPSFDTAGATGLSFVLVVVELLDLIKRSARTWRDPEVGRFLRFSSAFNSLTANNVRVRRHLIQSSKQTAFQSQNESLAEVRRHIKLSLHSRQRGSPLASSTNLAMSTGLLGLKERTGVVAFGVCSAAAAAAAEDGTIAALTGVPNFSRILDTFTLEKVNLADGGAFNAESAAAAGDADDEEAVPLEEAGAAGSRICGY